MVVYPSIESDDVLYRIIPTDPAGLSPVVPLGNLIALVTADASMAVAALNVTIVAPSAATVIAPVPTSVTVTLELPCATEFVDTVAKLNVPLPSVFKN